MPKTHPGRLRSTLLALTVASATICCVEAAGAQCVGDCNGDGMVIVNELIIGVNIALDLQPVSACPAFENDQGEVNVSQLIKGVNNALNGCPAGPTSTATEFVTPATASATLTATPTVTSTPVPVGEVAAGHAAVVAAGLGSVQSIIAAVVAQITNQGPSLTEVVVTNGLGVDACPISGTTSQLCTVMGSGAMTSIHLELGADACVAAGPAGGTAQFNGGITVDSDPGLPLFNDCDPIRFVAADFSTSNLSVIFRDNSMQQLLEATANVDGRVNVGVSLMPQCPIATVTLRLTGVLRSQSHSGGTIDVDFHDSMMTMTQIAFNEDCVPIKYHLTFNGAATITSMTPDLSVISGVPTITEMFDVTFSTFGMSQDATTNPPTVQFNGSMSSDCFGGQITLQTLAAPLAIAAGELCPTAGQVTVTGSGATATVTYGANGSVTIDQSGDQQMFSSCLAPELVMCP